MAEVCILSAQEAGKLEHWGVWPKCKNHRHVKLKAANDAARAGLIRFLGGEGTCVPALARMAVPVRTRIWQPVATSGMRGLRTWGLARSK